MTALNARSRGFDGDLSQGRWRGTDCPYCGTFYKRTRPQPNRLGESTQGERESCGDCGHTANIRWGRLVCTNGGIFFVADTAADIVHTPRVSGDDITQNHKLTPEEIEKLRGPE